MLSFTLFLILLLLATFVQNCPFELPITFRINGLSSYTLKLLPDQTFHILYTDGYKKGVWQWDWQENQGTRLQLTVNEVMLPNNDNGIGHLPLTQSWILLFRLRLSSRIELTALEPVYYRDVRTTPLYALPRNTRFPNPEYLTIDGADSATRRNVYPVNDL